jgi:hypothetical protein
MKEDGAETWRSQSGKRPTDKPVKVEPIEQVVLYQRVAFRGQIVFEVSRYRIE